jgi:hypothetical protein
MALKNTTTRLDIHTFKSNGGHAMSHAVHVDPQKILHVDGSFKTGCQEQFKILGFETSSCHHCKIENPDSRKIAVCSSHKDQRQNVRYEFR